MNDNTPPESIVNQPDSWAQYFKDKIDVPTGSWRELLDNEHRWAFSIAGITNAQILEDVRRSLIDELEKPDGLSYREWLKQFDQVTAKSGWQPDGWRSRLIFQQNIRNSFAAGRWHQMTDPKLLRETGGWQWRHRWPENPRREHLALNGKIYPPGERSFDRQGVPPGGHFHCHCVLTVVSQVEMEERGLAPLAPRPEIDRFPPGQNPQDRQETLQTLLGRLGPRWEPATRELIESKINSYLTQILNEFMTETHEVNRSSPDSTDL